jgi:hypothetical protein
VLAVLAVAFEFLEWQAPASFAKLGAATFAGWILLEVFEEVSWVVAVALVIPWVDAYSVWRGPTNTIVEHRGVFERLSFAFPVPGESGRRTSASRISSSSRSSSPRPTASDCAPG